MYSQPVRPRLMLMLAFLVAVAAALALARPAGAACPESGCGGGDPPPPDPTTLTITIVGAGSVSNGATQVCTAATSPCDLVYDSGDSVSLSASPATRYGFTGWTGDCSGTASCSLSMTADKSVTATFTHTIPAAPTISSPAAGTVFTYGSGSVSFSGSGAQYRCKVDSSSFSGATSCVSPWSTGALSTGNHTVYVWAVDSDGYVSSSASRNFKVVNRPDTSLSGTPADAAIVNTLTTNFSWSSPTGTTYACTLDGLVLASCESDLGSHLSDGTHTLTVAAGLSPFGDGITYYDTSPATRTWTIDTHAPDTSLSAGQSGTTTDPTATFGFGGADPSPGTALRFECRLDGGAWSPCESSSSQHYAGLGAGAHSFDVRAVDAAGNADPSPASRNWTVIVDADGDGFYSNTDCNDSNPAIHPGAVDTPGDGIDQDCSGADAAAAAGAGGAQGVLGSGPSSSGTVLAAKLSRGFKLKGKGTLVRKLRLSGVPAGARVTVRCSGHGCPFRHKSFAPKKGAVNLARAFRGRKLGGGAKIEIDVTLAGAKTQVFKLSTRAGRKPLVKTA